MFHQENESFEPACHYIGEQSSQDDSERISAPPQTWGEPEDELCH